MTTETMPADVAWFTAKQVAEHFQLPESTVQRKIRKGEIRAKNFGTDRCPRYRISRRELRRLEA